MKEEIETTIGAIIINNREYLKKDIADCANDLNIPIEYLDAVERDFFSHLYSGDMTALEGSSVPEDYYNYLESWYRAQKGK